MEIIFDTTKDQANIKDHGVSLAFGARVFEDEFHVVVSSLREIDGEHRYKAIGMVDGKIWIAVYVMRGAATRFISVRRANNGEEKIYHRP